MSSEQKRTFVEFGFWNPDSGDIANLDMFTMKNVVSYGNSFLPLYPRKKESTALSGTPLGFGFNPSRGWNDANYLLYYGNNTALYLIDPDDWTIYTKTNSGGAYSLTNSEYKWQLLAFGNNTIACCGNEEPVQYFVQNSNYDQGTELFVDMITSTEKPRFKFVAVLGGATQGLQIIGVGIGATGVSNIPSGGDVFVVSDVDDIRTFEFGGELSDSLQYPDDFGDYTGVCGTDYGALLFKRRRLLICDNSGPSGFEVRPVYDGDGTEQPNSIFTYGDSVLFFSTNGYPAEWNINTGLNRISYGSYTRALNESGFVSPGMNVNLDKSSKKYVFYGCYDPVMDSFLFSYRSSDTSSSDYSDRLISVNPMLSKDGSYYSAASDVDQSEIISKSNSDSRICSFVSVPSRDGSFSPYQSVVFVAEEGNSHFVFTFDIQGESKYPDPKFGTGFLNHPDVDIRSGEKLKTWMVTGIKPVILLPSTNTGAPAWRATVITKNIPWSDSGDNDYFTKTVESTTGVNKEGFLDFSHNHDGYGFFQKIEVEFDIELQSSANAKMFSNYIGFEIRYVDGGQYV